MSRVGIRGGRVRSVDQARALQEQFKPDWSARIRAGIVSALRRKEEFHADDLASLEIPAEHLNCVGAQVSGFVRKGYIFETGRRAASNAASNGRKSGVFSLTELGRRKLVGVSGADVATTSSPVSKPVRARARGLRENPHVRTADSGEHVYSIVWSWLEGEPPVSRRRVA